MVEGLTRRNQFDEAESVMSQFLTPAALQKSNCVDLVRLRGDTFARRGKWSEALADYKRALEYRPTEVQNYHAVAPLLVATTNLEEYRQLCPRIVERFRHTTDPSTADQMAKDCLVLASSGADLSAVDAMAGLAVNAGKEMTVYPFFQCCKALADYRQGHWNDAVYWATNAAVNPYAYSRGEAWAILAMSDYRLGQTNDARSMLAQCALLIEKQIPTLGHDLGPDWRDWIVLHALLKEAEELINAPSTSAGASTRK
jgi:eukaryotic-like serine/threonine-protein kinase